MEHFRLHLVQQPVVFLALGEIAVNPTKWRWPLSWTSPIDSSIGNVEPSAAARRRPSSYR